MIQVCSQCKPDVPLINTFERPKAEWHCLGCGGWFELFRHRLVEATPEMVRYNDALVDLFRGGARGPIDVAAVLTHVQTQPVPPPADDNVKCDGCGADSGRTKSQGKPAAWYQRTDADGDQHACSRECITKIAKDSGKTSLVLPW